MKIWIPNALDSIRCDACLSYSTIWPFLFCSCLGNLRGRNATETFQIQQKKRFSKLGTWDPYSYAGDPGAASGSPGTTKEAARGPGSWALARSRPWALALAASFVVPGDPETAPGSPAYEYGSQVANLENLYLLGLRIMLCFFLCFGLGFENKV